MSSEDEEVWCVSCGKILKENDIYYEEKTDLPYCEKCAKEKIYKSQRRKPLSKEETLEQRIRDLEARLSQSHTNVDKTQEKLGVLGILFGLSGISSIMLCFIFPSIFPIFVVSALISFGLCYYFLSD